MRYHIVTSETLDTYIATQGEIGVAIEAHDKLSTARQHAETLAYEYHYGVDIVDTEIWDVA